jgi:DNA-directed RNA polymerase subunit alpha
MDQATVNFADVIESDKIDLAELDALRKAAFGSESAWRQLREIAQKFQGGKPPAALARRVKRGWVLLTLGRPNAAARELEEAKAAGDPAGALFLGRAYLELRESKKALEAFEAGLKKAKGDLELKLGEIEALREAGDAKEALKEAKGLEKSHGDRAEVHFQIAASQEALGEYDAAMDRYEEALERDAQHARSLFRLAYNHELHGSNDLALDYYRRCADATPTYPNALVNLGLMLEDRSLYQAAIEVYHKVLRVRPNHVRARMFLKDAEASLDMYYDEDQEKKSDRRNAILRIPVTDFELSVRARNCLNKMNIRNLGDLVTKTEEELLAYKNFGETSLQEIKQMLAQKGLRLGMFREGAGALPAAAPDEEKKANDDEMLKKPIGDLELSVRSRNCMERLNIKSIGELCQRSETELLAVKNFGHTSLNEIKQRLGELGLTLRQEAPLPAAAEPAPGLEFGGEPPSILAPGGIEEEEEEDEDDDLEPEVPETPETPETPEVG